METSTRFHPAGNTSFLSKGRINMNSTWSCKHSLSQWHSQGLGLHVQRRSSRPSTVHLLVSTLPPPVPKYEPSISYVCCTVYDDDELARSTRQKKNGSAAVAAVKLHPPKHLTAGRHLQGLLINRFISKATVSRTSQYGLLAICHRGRAERGNEFLSHQPQQHGAEA